MALVLLVPGLALAYGETIENRTSNPYVPKQGYVIAGQICYNARPNTFTVYIPSHNVETCESFKWDYTDSKYPKRVCVGRGLKRVPAAYVEVSRAYKAKVCTKVDSSDSTRPVCVKTEIQTRQYPLEYTQSVYEMSDYRHERPITVKTRVIQNCK
jgi:hypothetical protein